jgi:hypothetical protein
MLHQKRGFAVDNRQPEAIRAAHGVGYNDVLRRNAKEDDNERNELLQHRIRWQRCVVARDERRIVYGKVRADGESVL